MECLSLYDLNTYIRQAVALNFPEPIWIVAEIASAKEVKNHTYLELVQKDHYGEKVIAQCKAALWALDFKKISKSAQIDPTTILKEGSEVKIAVVVEFHERYGINLTIKDVDSSYTLGQLELKKLEILKKLQVEGLTDLNKSNNSLSLVPLNIAIISSNTAAGYIDFLHQLETNPYQYYFKLHLFQSRMQGNGVSEDIISNLREISNRKSEFNAIVIIRGGGSKLDLNDFNDFNIAKEIALTNLPVITGIGHEIDITVVDTVAYLSLKTPTAVANFLIDRVSDFESKLANYLRTIRINSNSRIQFSAHQLALLLKKILYNANNNISNKKHLCLNLLLKARFSAKMALLERSNKAQNLFQKIQSNDPRKILSLGYALLYLDQEKILSTHNSKLQPGKSLTVIMNDGKISTTINQIDKND